MPVKLTVAAIAAGFGRRLQQGAPTSFVGPVPGQSVTHAPGMAGGAIPGAVLQEGEEEERVSVHALCGAEEKGRSSPHYAACRITDPVPYGLLVHKSRR